MQIGGRILGGTIKTKYAQEGAKDTANSSYEIVADIFKQLTVYDDDVLVDVGCGKGRVLNFWINRFPNNEKIGIELDPDVAAFTRERLKKYTNCEIISGNIIDYLPQQGTIFFLFNPFEEYMVEKFKNTIKEQGSDNVVIVYLLCEHINVFENDEEWEIRYIQKKKRKWHTTAVIMRKERSDDRIRLR